MVSQFLENKSNEEAIRNGIRIDSLPSCLPHAGHMDVLHVFCFQTHDMMEHPLGSRYKGTCDGDNLEKAVWDALNGVLWYDDSWISQWSSKKVWWWQDGIYLAIKCYE